MTTFLSGSSHDRDAPDAGPSAPSQDVALVLTLVSLVMGLVLLLKWVIKACQPEDEYPWPVTYRGLLARDEEFHNTL